MLLLGVAYFFCGIYPGSSKTVLLFDVREQFLSFYASLRYLGQDGESLGFHWLSALGGNGIGFFAYYLADPFALLCNLFSLKALPNVLYVLNIIKCGLCAFSFFLFLYFRPGKVAEKSWEDLPRQEIPWGMLLLSLSYALSSAAVVMTVLPMYLNSMILLPLVILGLEILVDRDWPVLFILAFATALITQYYAGYMIGLFVLLYYFYLMAGRTMNARSLFRVLGAGLCACLLSGPMLLPAAVQLFAGKIGDAGAYSDGGLIVTSPGWILRNLLPFDTVSLYSDGRPALYIGVLALGLSLYYWKNPDIQKSSKIRGGILLGIFFASFMLRPLYRIWHGFRDPVAYPNRFSFLVIFFVLTLAADSLPKIKFSKLPWKVLLPAICILCLDLGYGARMQIASMVAMLPCASSEEYEFFLDITEPMLQEIAALENRANPEPGTWEEQKGFGQMISAEGNPENSKLRITLNGQEIPAYRVEKDYLFSSNDAMLLGYPGISHFSSTYDAKVLEFLKNLGYLQYHYKTFEDGSTLLGDSVLGIRYELCRFPTSSAYRELDSNGFVRLCENPYALGLAYYVPETALAQPAWSENPFENLNLLGSSLLGISWEGYRPLDYEENVENYVEAVKKQDSTEEGAQGYTTRTALSQNITFVAGGGAVYLNFPLLRETELSYEEKENSPTITVLQEERVLGAFDGFQRSANLYLGEFEAGEIVEIRIRGGAEPRQVFLYEESERAVADLSQSLKNSAGSEYLMLTLPYDKGYRIRVDGREVRPEMALGTFLTIPVEENSREIELSYTPPGTYAGWLMGAFGLLLLLLLRKGGPGRYRMDES